MHRPLISHRDIARTTRFQHHPTMSACWIWTGHTDRGVPEIKSTRLSARQDVYERIMGRRPGGKLKPGCGVGLCVNPHHMRGGGLSLQEAGEAPETAATPASAATADTSSPAPRDPR